MTSEPKTNPFLIGTGGPAVLVPARIASMIMANRGTVSELRIRVRGIDPEASGVLEALHHASLEWRGTACGTTDDTKAEPATDSNQWLTTGEAADLAGVTSRAIRKATDEGRLPHTRVGGHRRISRQDLEHYKATRVA